MMGLFDFLSKPSTEAFDPSTMSRQELDRQFSPRRWDELSYSKRCDCLRELERRLAQEQGRPAKMLRFVPMKAGCCGYWSETQNCISINDTLVSDSSFMLGTRLVLQPDAPFQLYETVAHEGYHAYQSYALEHPECHPDQQQLAEWRLNSAEGRPGGAYENNYYPYKLDRDRYRIQPLERDAFAFGQEETRAAFDAMEAREGELPGYQDYLDNCEFDSYENALNQAQLRDENTLSHMEREMQDRVNSWERGESCGEIGQEQYYQPLPDEQLTPQEVNAVMQWQNEPYSRYEEMKAMDNPYADDTSHIVHVRGYSGDTAVRASKLEQYQEGLQSLKEAFPNYQTDPRENFVFRSEVHRMQDDLEYYPELDPRMTEVMKNYRGTPYEQTARDEIGFYPYDESCAGESAELHRENKGLDETEDVSMEDLHSEESAELHGEADGLDETEDVSMEDLYSEESAELHEESEGLDETEDVSMEDLHSEESAELHGEADGLDETEEASMEDLHSEKGAELHSESESLDESEEASMESLYENDNAESPAVEESMESYSQDSSPSVSSGVSQSSGLNQ